MNATSENFLDNLVTLINSIEELKADNDELESKNKDLKRELQKKIFDFAGWRVIKLDTVPIGQMWINSNYDLSVESVGYLDKVAELEAKNQEIYDYLYKRGIQYPVDILSGIKELERILNGWWNKGEKNE